MLEANIFDRIRQYLECGILIDLRAIYGHS